MSPIDPGMAAQIAEMLQLGERNIGGRPGRFDYSVPPEIGGTPGPRFAYNTEEGGSPSLNPIDGHAHPDYVDRKARLAAMDEQGVEACLMLPTTGVSIEPQLREPRHREALYPSVRAFNRWLEEDWGYGADGRIFGAPILSLLDLG